MTYNDPLITYNGAPTDAFFAQMMAKLTSAPADTVAALQATTIPVNATQGAWPTATENADAVWSKTLP